MALSEERQFQLDFLTPLVDDILDTNIQEHISYEKFEMKIEI